MSHSTGRADEDMLLGDDLFLVGLNDRDGKLRAADDLLGLALAGALIAELVVTGSVVVDAGVVYADNRHPLPGPMDPLSWQVYATLTRERQPVSKWLPYLAAHAQPPALEAVTNRLETHRVIASQRTGLLGRMAYHPADRPMAAWRGIRLYKLCERQNECNLRDLVLLGLAEACGLWDHIFAIAPDARRYAQRQVARLDDSPAWREQGHWAPWSAQHVITEVRAQITSAPYSHHR
jgi:hypothetical protein